MGSTLLVSLWAQSLVLCPIEQIMKSTLQITVIRVRTEEYPLNADMGRKKNKEKKTHWTVKKKTTNSTLDLL